MSDDYVYELELGPTLDAQTARRTVSELVALVATDRSAHPRGAEHSLVLTTPLGMSPAVRAVLFPAFTDAFDAVTVEGPRSWIVAEPALTAEAALPTADAWSRVRDRFEAGAPLTANVVATAPEGLTIDVGCRGFLPEDQIDLRPIKDLSALVGRKLEVRVVRFDLPTETLVVSRRALLEERRDVMGRATRARLHEGAIVRGKVTSLTEFGAFVDLGGATGLLSVSALQKTVARVPAEVFSVGDEDEFVVLEYDPGEEPIELGLHRSSPV